MRTHTLSLAALTLLFCGWAHADFAISNYPPDPVNSYTIWVWPGFVDFYAYAVPITPNNGEGPGDEKLPLGALTVPIQAPVNPNSTNLRVYLANDLNSPTFVCRYIDYGAAPAGGGWDGDVLLNPLDSVSVQEGLTYWVVARAQPSDLYTWSYSTGTDARIGQPMYLDGSGIWRLVDPNPLPPDAVAPAFILMVPEPASLGLLALAGVASLAGRRRRAA